MHNWFCKIVRISGSVSAAEYHEFERVVWSTRKTRDAVGRLLQTDGAFEQQLCHHQCHRMVPKLAFQYRENRHRPWSNQRSFEPHSGLHQVSLLFPIFFALREFFRKNFAFRSSALLNDNTGLNMPCISSWGAPIDALVVLGGYSGWFIFPLLLSESWFLQLTSLLLHVLNKIAKSEFFRLCFWFQLRPESCLPV